jgi:hypothetical protein
VGNDLRKDRGGHGPFVGSPETGSAAPVSPADAQITEQRPFLEIRGKLIGHNGTDKITFELTIRNLSRRVAVSPVLGFEKDSWRFPLLSLMEAQGQVQRIDWVNTAGTTLNLNWWVKYSTITGEKLTDRGTISAGYYPHLPENFRFDCQQTDRYE